MGVDQQFDSLVQLINTSKPCKYAGIEELGNGVWKVFYRNVFLGYINNKLLKYREKSIR